MSCSGHPVETEDHWLRVAPGMTWRLLLVFLSYSIASAAVSLGSGDLAVMLMHSLLPVSIVRISAFIIASCIAVIFGDWAMCRLKKIIHW